MSVLRTTLDTVLWIFGGIKQTKKKNWIKQIQKIPNPQKKIQIMGYEMKMIFWQKMEKHYIIYWEYRKFLSILWMEVWQVHIIDYL